MDNPLSSSIPIYSPTQAKHINKLTTNLKQNFEKHKHNQSWVRSRF